jgi:tRNA threonylcarbamoyladenosine biosynthesis protein TsaB
VRTGLAAARGIALAWGLPVLGVTTLRAVALAAHRAAPSGTSAWPIVVVLDSRRATVFAQRFEADLSAAGEPHAARPEEIAAALPEGGVLLAGDAAARVIDTGAIAPSTLVRYVAAARLPHAVCVAEIAAARWEAGNATPAELAAAPLYLSPPEAKRPAGGGRLRP